MVSAEFVLIIYISLTQSITTLFFALTADIEQLIVESITLLCIVYPLLHLPLPSYHNVVDLLVRLFELEATVWVPDTFL